MIQEFLSIFKSGFLLHNALYGSIAVGLFCPLIGVYFYLRRMVLLGVALPHVSAAGIAFIFFLQGLGFQWSLHAGEQNDRFLALIGSSLFTLIAIFVLAYFERRGDGTTESRLGATYSMAFAMSVLFVTQNALGKAEFLGMLNGEIVAVSSKDMHLLVLTYGLLTAALIFLNRHFIFVSFDRETARVMGKNILLWDGLLYSMVGITISIGVLIVGPMLTFAFLIIPPLAARRFSPGMTGFFFLSSIIGGLSGLLGFFASYHLDWPLAPTDIAVSFFFLCACFVGKKAQSLFSR